VKTGAFGDRSSPGSSEGTRLRIPLWELLSEYPGVHRPNCEFLSVSWIHFLKVHEHLRVSNRTSRAFVASEETPRIQGRQENSSKKTVGCGTQLRSMKQVCDQVFEATWLHIDAIANARGRSGRPVDRTSSTWCAQRLQRGAQNAKKPCSHVPVGSRRTAPASIGRTAERRPGRLLLVSLPLQKLALLVLTHLLPALLDHAAHGDSPLALWRAAGPRRAVHSHDEMAREAVFRESPRCCQAAGRGTSSWRPEWSQARENAPRNRLRAVPSARFTGCRRGRKGTIGSRRWPRESMARRIASWPGSII